jgi:hypothetical protein
MDALAGLDLIDWAHIRSSERDNSLEVPLQLRRLADEVDGTPDRWADRLHQLVVHEHSGCIVQSAEYVVPFLVRLCESDRAAVARAALLLLSDLMTEPFHTEAEFGNEEMYGRTQAAIRAGHDSIPQDTVYIRPSLHPSIIDHNRSKRVQRHAGINQGVPRRRPQGPRSNDVDKRPDPHFQPGTGRPPGATGTRRSTPRRPWVSGPTRSVSA